MPSAVCQHIPNKINKGRCDLLCTWFASKRKTLNDGFAQLNNYTAICMACMTACMTTLKAQVDCAQNVLANMREFSLIEGE